MSGALDRERAAAHVALSLSLFEQEVRVGNAPQPRQLSARRVGWLLRELDEWLEARPISKLPPPPNTGAKKPKVG